MNILADASLPGLQQAFPPPFNLSLYRTRDELSQALPHQDILLCRSTLKVDQSLLKNIHLKFVATASSGTDHIDKHYLSGHNITLIDAKGCNASAVADYVVSCLSYIKQQGLLQGKKAAIIGIGKVGSQVYQRLNALDFDIYPYDPLQPQYKDCSIQSVFDCNLICIHAELHYNPPHPSFNLINGDFINQLSRGCILINAARGGIVDEAALLESNRNLIYCTDVYLNEPHINDALINHSLIATPHIAGHSLEAKYLAVAMVSEQLHRTLNLPVPEFAAPEKPIIKTFDDRLNWEKQILSIYNPMIETNQLKQAHDKPLMFQQLRKKHQTRHTFSTYFEAIDNPRMKTLLGF